jgi:hypothetical protein
MYSFMSCKSYFQPRKCGAFITILITTNALCLKSKGGHRAHCMARYYLPRHQALCGTCFGSQCPTTGNSVSHTWAPVIIICRTSQASSMTLELCHCQLWFYLFFCLRFIIINLQSMREGHTTIFQIFSKKKAKQDYKNIVG